MPLGVEDKNELNRKTQRMQEMLDDPTLVDAVVREGPEHGRVAGRTRLAFRAILDGTYTDDEGQLALTMLRVDEQLNQAA